jgi:hypothetical protein
MPNIKTDPTVKDVYNPGKFKVVSEPAGQPSNSKIKSAVGAKKSGGQSG